MKKLTILLLLAGTVSVASAQHGRVMIRPAYRPSTTVVIGGGYYSPFYSPYYYGYPYYGPSVQAAPSKLDQDIADINHDYAERIESVRMNESLKGKDRRHEIRTLKDERDHEIDLAKRNYYKQ